MLINKFIQFVDKFLMLNLLGKNLFVLDGFHIRFFICKMFYGIITQFFQNCIDLVILFEQVSHILQAVITGESIFLRFEDVADIIVDLGKIIIEALFAELADGTGGRNIEDRDNGSIADPA